MRGIACLVGAIAAAPLACGARTPLGARDAGADAGADAGDAGDRRDAGDAGDAAADSGADGGTCPFATDATVPGTLRVTTDDNTVLYFDGTLVDATPRLWSDPQQYAVKVLRHPSARNAIAIEGTNRQNVSGPDRGVIADLEITLGAQKVHVVTSGTWRLSTTSVPGWFDPTVDVSGWKGAVVEGPYGMPPWGPVFGAFGVTSTASWLWSYDSNLPSGSKPVVETIWLRRDFFLAIDGTVRDTPGPCP